MFQARVCRHILKQISTNKDKFETRECRGSREGSLDRKLADMRRLNFHEIRQQKKQIVAAAVGKYRSNSEAVEPSSLSYFDLGPLHRRPSWKTRIYEAATARPEVEASTLILLLEVTTQARTLFPLQVNVKQPFSRRSLQHFDDDTKNRPTVANLPIFCLQLETRREQRREVKKLLLHKLNKHQEDFEEREQLQELLEARLQESQRERLGVARRAASRAARSAASRAAEGAVRLIKGVNHSFSYKSFVCSLVRKVWLFLNEPPWHNRIMRA